MWLNKLMDRKWYQIFAELDALTEADFAAMTRVSALAGTGR